MRKISVIVFLILLTAYTLFSASIRSESRIIVAVTKFKTFGAPDEVAEAVYEHISSSIVKSHKYHVVERSLLDKIVKEAAFSHSDLAQRSTAVRLGRLLSATQIIVGKIIKLGATYSISARLVNVVNARIINSEIVKVKNISELGEACTALTYKLLSLPYSTGAASSFLRVTNYKRGIIGTWKIVRPKYAVYISFYRNGVFKETRLYYRRNRRPLRARWTGTYVIRNRVLGLFARNLRWLDTNFLIIDMGGDFFRVKILGNPVSFERVR